MLKNILTFLHQVPFWVWVIIPALLLGGICYLVTKNRRNSARVTIIALCAAWLTAGLHLYEVYLANHFVVRFDSYGLPGSYSRSDWLLLVDAWPIWVVPSLIASCLLTAYLWYIWKYKNPVTPLIKPTSYQRAERITTISAPIEDSVTAGDKIAYQLELDTQKRKASKAIQQLQHEKQQQELSKQDNAAADQQNATLIKELALKSAALKQAKQEIEQQAQELEQANALTEKLLDKCYGIDDK